jgi:hypothetical protein
MQVQNYHTPPTNPTHFSPPKHPSNASSELKESVRASSRLEDVVSECGVQLRRAGVQLVGRCPIHSEKTPSFYVHPTKQLFHCHACGQGGDVFAFVMAVNNCTFREALQHLASRAGIEVDGFRPSPELQARVATLKAAREKEVAFEKWFNKVTWAITDRYRQLGRAVNHAEDYLCSIRVFDPAIEDMAWTILRHYVNFTNKLEEGRLLTVDVMRPKWLAQQAVLRVN